MFGEFVAGMITGMGVVLMVIGFVKLLRP